MEPLRPESPNLIPELEAPSFLREQLRQMQAEAPDWGLGFEKSRLDAAMHARLLEHLEANAAHFRPEHRISEIGNADPGMIPALLYEDRTFNEQIAAELKRRHEAWSGMTLEYSWCYGIRVYQRGTYLYNHVDRPTHIVSSAICVASALDEPWPLHLEDKEGRVSQVNLEPGEFVYYEGARLAHGRPYPLRGDYYASMFIHYRPLGWQPQEPGPR